MEAFISWVYFYPTYFVQLHFRGHTFYRRAIITPVSNQCLIRTIGKLLMHENDSKIWIKHSCGPWRRSFPKYQFFVIFLSLFAIERVTTSCKYELKNSLGRRLDNWKKFFFFKYYKKGSLPWFWDRGDHRYRIRDWNAKPYEFCSRSRWEGGNPDLNPSVDLCSCPLHDDPGTKIIFR